MYNIILHNIFVLFIIITMQSLIRKVFDLQSIEDNKRHMNIFLQRINDYSDFQQILNEKTYSKVI